MHYMRCECAGDEEARARGTQKTVLERVAPPTFPLVIEMRERANWVTHWVEDSVDCLLHGKVPIVQVRPSALPPAWSPGLPFVLVIDFSFCILYCALATCSLLAPSLACTSKCKGIQQVEGIPLPAHRRSYKPV